MNELDKRTRRKVAHAVLRELGKGRIEGGDVEMGIYNSDSDSWETVVQRPIGIVRRVEGDNDTNQNNLPNEP